MQILRKKKKLRVLRYACTGWRLGFTRTSPGAQEGGGETEEPIGRQHPTQLSITLCGRDCALPQPSFLQLGEFQWTIGSPKLCI